ncbi:MAG TPA: DUF5606 domain-containing protein [Puia sp.]|nr:DUF5606 domain-containing protein [Puia sp.]
MEYSKIVAITGLPGLYELINSKTDGAIVRSLDDKSTRFVSSRIHQFSHLESIEIYTVKENVNLVDILKAMEGSVEKLPDEKNEEVLKRYFQKVYPDIDFDRVYNSDLKKMVRWFSALKKHNIEIKLPEVVEEPVVEAKKEEPVEAPAVKEKKTAAPKKTRAEEKEPEEKSKAKKPAKKKTEEKKQTKTKEKATKAPAKKKTKK